MLEVMGESLRWPRKMEESRELVWSLDLPGQVEPKWHLQLVLCEPDVETEAELRLVPTHSAGLFEVSVRVDESGAKWHRSVTPFGRGGLYSMD